jgi:hypothetical protein
MIFAEALVSFAAFFLLLSHLSSRGMRRLVGYKALADIVLHGTVLFMFFGTSTEGLIQAEAAAVLFSVYLRVYVWAKGWERFDWKQLRWRRFAGRFT